MYCSCVYVEGSVLDLPVLWTIIILQGSCDLCVCICVCACMLVWRE